MLINCFAQIALYVLMFRQWLFKRFSLPMKCLDASVMLFVYNLDVCFMLQFIRLCSCYNHAYMCLHV